MNRKTLEGKIRELFPDAEDEAVSALIDNVMANNGRDIKSLQETVESINTELERLKGVEEEYEGVKKANMTAEEQMQTAQKEAEAKVREYNTMINRLEAERGFVSAGIPEDDYKDLLDVIVTDDANASKASAAKLLDLLTKQKEAAVKATKEELLKETPRPLPNEGTGSAQSLTEQYQAALESGDMARAAAIIRQSAQQSQIDTTTT